MIALDIHRSHSADVAIHLLINGNALPVAQLGPDFLLLRGVADHPPCDAVVKLLCEPWSRNALVVAHYLVNVRRDLRMKDKPHQLSIHQSTTTPQGWTAERLQMKSAANVSQLLSRTKKAAKPKIKPAKSAI